jgi:hypothetical protein
MRQSSRVSSAAAQARSVEHCPKFRLFLRGAPILRTKSWIYLGLIVAAFLAFRFSGTSFDCVFVSYSCADF